MADTCTCGHPAAYHTGPYTACGAMNCRCTRFEPEEESAPDCDGEFSDDPPTMECAI